MPPQEVVGAAVVGCEKTGGSEWTFVKKCMVVIAPNAPRLRRRPLSCSLTAAAAAAIAGAQRVLARAHGSNDQRSKDHQSRVAQRPARVAEALRISG